MPTIREPAREIPVLMDADIVVVGGGTTGPIACRSCRAPEQESGYLVERFGSLGGNLTLGLNTKPSGAPRGGLPLELWKMARATGAAGAGLFSPGPRRGRSRSHLPATPKS